MVSLFKVGGQVMSMNQMEQGLVRGSYYIAADHAVARDFDIRVSEACSKLVSEVSVFKGIDEEIGLYRICLHFEGTTSGVQALLTELGNLEREFSCNFYTEDEIC